MKSRTILASWAVVVSMLCGAAAALRAEEAPADFGTPDVTLELSAVPAKMKFSRESMHVKPGAKVKLTFTNPDVMEHNVVICKPGKPSGVDVAKLAWAMGADGPAKDFIPKTPAILAHTKVVAPGKSESIFFTAPQAEGEYPFICTLPGHVFLMNGILTVSQSPPLALRDIQYRYFLGAWSTLPDFDKLKPEASGALTGEMLETTFVKTGEHFGIAYDAALDIPADGKYAFTLASDDGSKLLIDGKPVINNDGNHSATEKRGEAQLTKGEHKLRLEYFNGSGEWSLALSVTPPSGRAKSLTVSTGTLSNENQLTPTTEPLVVRCGVEGSGPRSIAVGFAEGLHYVFDAGTGSVRFAWTGGFLDVSNDRNGRGGNATKPLGTRFSVGDEGFPLRFSASDEKPAFTFRGYQRGDHPQFFMTAEGVDVVQKISPAAEGIGLTYSFELSKSQGTVRFIVKPDGLKLSASAGTWNGGVLTVPADQAKSFTVTLIKAQ